MQLNLLARLSPRAGQARHDPPSTVPGAWRDSAISQLDALAAANERIAAARLRRQAAGLAMVGAVALLVSAALWRPPREATPRPIVSAAVTEARPVMVVARQPPGAAAPSSVAAPMAPAAAVQPAAASEIDEAARKARAAQAVEARRKAAQQAQERSRAEEAARADEQQRRLQDESEQAAQRQQAELARERAAAAEQVRRQATLLAQASPRSVREACAASGGFLAEQFCHARECRKPEHQGDAVCSRLRDIELARLQHTADH